jgi:hypothetical protein
LYLCAHHTQGAF